MKINSLNLNCQKPRHFGESVATESSSKKIRLKHFEQLDDDTLMLKSIMKAHKDVNKSNKMKLYKAMPAITIGTIGTIFALTQPGKLSSKHASGLGFLVLAKAYDKVSDGVDKLVDNNWKDKEDNSNVIAKTVVKAGAAAAGTALAAVALYAGKDSIAKQISKSSNKFAQVLTHDAAKFVSEINSTKLGQFVSKKMIPFENANLDKINKANIIAPFAALAGFVAARGKLSENIADDMQRKAINNFAKSKIIQSAARDEFNKIDAKEV